MSVENFDCLGGVVEFLDEATPENCFHCGKPLAGLTVFWHGSGQWIALHPHCGEYLGARLIRDSLNAKLIGEDKSPTSGISPGLFNTS